VRLVFEDHGWEDYTSWLKTDRKMLARINKLIEDVRRDPFTGIGKPGPLRYHLPGAWSRRIDDEHRLVYIVTEAEVIILAPATTTDLTMRPVCLSGTVHGSLPAGLYGARESAIRCLGRALWVNASRQEPGIPL
jgi:toxin YoeB